MKHLIETQRLLLGPLKLTDLDDVVLYLNQSPVFSENTLHIPFPYHKKDAVFWYYEIVEKGFENQTSAIFAIRKKENSHLIGAIGIHINQFHHKAEVGYWLGTPFWNQGFATEALSAIIQFGFEVLNLNKIYATHFLHNESSGVVMKKCGMIFEGILRQEFNKNGKFLDAKCYAILRQDLNG